MTAVLIPFPQTCMSCDETLQAGEVWYCRRCQERHDDATWERLYGSSASRTVDERGPR